MTCAPAASTGGLDPSQPAPALGEAPRPRLLPVPCGQDDLVAEAGGVIEQGLHGGIERFLIGVAVRYQNNREQGPASEFAVGPVQCPCSAALGY